MDYKCQFCGKGMDKNTKKCPYCGYENEFSETNVSTVPKTIEELQQWYQDRKLPPERVTRFFIGKDIREPKAFGIYQNEQGEFVVYKNKDTGVRAIRYQGPDEAYAVNEIFQKLKSEIKKRKSPKCNGKQNKIFGYIMIPCAVVLILLLMFLEEMFHIVSHTIVSLFYAALICTPILFIIHKVSKRIKKKNRITGFLQMTTKKVCLTYLIATACVLPFVSHYLTPKYYQVNQNIYCEYKGDYYCYEEDDYFLLEIIEIPLELMENKSDYRWRDYDEQISFVAFEDSDYYDTYFAADNDSSYDSDSSYDWSSSDSWDSGGTDWGSDW